jgi:glycosyltransferase involved in cell wall biosynthesis
MNACFQEARRLVRRATPPRLRALLGNGAVRLGVPSAQPVARPCEMRLTILGPLGSPSGIGEGARLAAEAFADLGFAVGLIDVTPLLQLPSGGPLLAERPSFTAGDIGGPLIVHLNPPHFQLALYRLGLSGRTRPLIAAWAWELTEVPRLWHRAFRIPHEVWVPSRFVATALRASGCKTPVRVVPHPVSTSSRLAPIEHQSRRGLRVLNCFAYDSSFDRKNPLAAVAAFRRAFGARQDVELIVKTQGPRSDTCERALLTAVAGAENIRVMDRTIARADQRCLVRGADVTISLHRAEGFGLSLAEAMASGRPVIATHGLETSIS